MKGWLVFIGLLALIDPRRPQVVTKDVEENQYGQKNVGFIKLGEERLLYVSDDRYTYSYLTGECLDYAWNQKIPFVECNPDAIYSYEAISQFTENTYENLEESYFRNHTFPNYKLHIFEILNLTTNEIQYLIGEKEKENQLFNFETYLVEDYTGYAIKEIDFTFDKNEYYYSEILELIQNYRENNQNRKLERK